MADPIVTGDALFAHHYPHTVYTRDTWGASWMERPHLYCDFLQLAAGPTVTSAQLQYRYGVGMRPGESSFAEVPPLEVVDHFVKVEVDQGDEADPIVWIGRIKDESDERHGAAIIEAEDEEEEETRIPSGVQYFAAYGMEVELDRVILDRSRVQLGEGEQEISRALAFNCGQGDSREVVVGNATPADGAEELGEFDTKIFAASLATAVKWNAQTILEYLFAYFSPRDAVGELQIQFKLFGQLTAIDWHEPRLDVHGRTLLEVLNGLIDRRRLASYRVWVNDDTGIVVVDVFSLADESIDLTGGKSIPANLSQKTLDFDRAFDIRRAAVRTAAIHQVDEVLCRGERRGGCCTVSAVDGTLVKDWTDAQQTAYNTGASAEAGYGALRRDEKQARNAAVRETDLLTRVFSYFRLPDDWDGFANDGEAGEIPSPVCPKLDADGNPTAQTVNFWAAGQQLESRLPLLASRDYTASVTSPADSTPTGSLSEPLPCFALQLIGTNRYQYVDKLATESFDQVAPLTWSASCRVQDFAPGIVLKVNQAGQQHQLARTQFTPADDTDIPGDVDWQNNLIATVFLLADEHVEARYPDELDLPAGATKRTMLIRVPNTRLDYVVPGTVVGLSNNGALQRTAAGGFVRDDRPRLKGLAQAYFHWYGTYRQILDLTYRQLTGLFVIGDLITEIGAADSLETINTVVSSVRIDLIAGTTSIQTQFDELDVL